MEAPDMSPEPGLAPADAERERRYKRKRLVGFIVIALFVGFGVLFFGGRMPKEVQLRFEMPPTARSGDVAIPRARMSGVSAAITGGDGDQVATVNLPLPNGLEGPRTAAVVLNLRAGSYAVRARVRSFEGLEVTLGGTFEAASGEVVVDLR